MRLHAQICNKNQCLLFDENKNMIGMLESNKLLYLIARLNAVIDNPEAIDNENIVIRNNGAMNITKSVQNMHQKGFSVLEMVNQIGVNEDRIHQLLSRVKKEKAAKQPN